MHASAAEVSRLEAELARVRRERDRLQETVVALKEDNGVLSGKVQVLQDCALRNHQVAAAASHSLRAQTGHLRGEGLEL